MSTMKIRSMISQILTYLNAYFYERIVGSSNEIIWIGNNVQKWDINLILRDLTQVIKGPSSQVIKPIFHQTSKLDYQNINNKKCNWKCLWRARVITEAIVKNQGPLARLQFRAVLMLTAKVRTFIVAETFYFDDWVEQWPWSRMWIGNFVAISKRVAGEELYLIVIHIYSQDTNKFFEHVPLLRASLIAS